MPGEAVLAFSADERLGGTGEGRCRRSIVIRGKYTEVGEIHEYKFIQ